MNNIETRNGSRTLIEVFGMWLAVLLGIVNCGVLVWKGGALSQSLIETRSVVDGHTRMIESIQIGGSSRLSSHAEIQRERELLVESRIAKVENAILAINDIKLVLAGIQKDMDYLTSKRSAKALQDGSMQPQSRNY